MAAPMVNPTPYIQAIAPWLPANYPLKLQSLCQSSEDVLILEVVLRFLCGGDCPPDAAPRVRQEWPEKQHAVTLSIQALRGPPRHDPKRKLEDPGGPLSNVPKKMKMGNGLPNGHHAVIPGAHPMPPNGVVPHPQYSSPQPPPSPSQSLKVSQDSPTPHSAPAIPTDERPFVTLHAVSVTSPVRKKVDITIGQSSVQMLNPVTAAIEATLPVAIFTRAFILPTRGKSKPHWTVAMLSSDEPGKPQVIFGLDAMSPPGYKTTEYDPPYKSQTHHPRNTPTIPSLRAFLRHLPAAPILEPTTAVFRSAVQPSAFNATSTQPSPDRPEGVPGVEAYRGAKQGTLWFFHDGILWGESKPCEFWACHDLAGAGEALRLISATGRTCSLYLKRANRTEQHDDGSVADVEGLETEFSMIDGKEQDPISAWVRAHRHLFGGKHGADKAAADAKGKAKANGPPPEPGYWGKVTLSSMPEASDSDDESYKQSGSDDGSASSSSADGSRSGGSEASAAPSQSGESDDVQDELEHLNTENHPLLRPGAMPKRVSKAAMAMVVDMMGGENEGERKRGVPPPPPYAMLKGGEPNGNGVHSRASSTSETRVYDKVNGNGKGHVNGVRGATKRKNEIESEDDDGDIEVDELDD